MDEHEKKSERLRSNSAHRQDSGRDFCTMPAPRLVGFSKLYEFHFECALNLNHSAG